MAKIMLHKVRAVADQNRVTNRTVIEWIRQGKLTAIRLPSGHFRITDASLQQLMCPGRKSKAAK